MTRIALVFVLAIHAIASEVGRVQAVDSIRITVSDLDRAVEFYTKVLEFRELSTGEEAGEELERATGVFGARVRTARLQLGEEKIELREFLAPRGMAFPADSRSNDHWFQHIAIVTHDMPSAYRWLRQHKVKHLSSGPQKLPDWNPNAAGIEAFYFQDPDGHALEIISFPVGKGLEKWREQAQRLNGDQHFLGIDHTAIVIQDTEDSLRFYRDQLGLRVVGQSENYGVEQERLNGVFGARLRITSLRADSGPGIEFLQYLSPSNGRPYPSQAQANDILHWQTQFAGTGARYFFRDPDGHALEIVNPTTK